MCLKGRVVTVTGPKGTICTDFSHANSKLKIVDTPSFGRKLVVRQMNQTTKTGAVVRSVCSTVKKMIVGVQTGYRYKMKMVYAHFPIGVKITPDNKTVEIRNFLGEKIVRRVTARGDDTTFSTDNKEKETLIVTGNDIESVSQSAANVQQICKVKDKDIRKFLDGCYVSAKENVVVEEE
jgi:large subunit ribosomal protein L9e